MKAFILAAGIGARLHPLTEHKPKCMVRIYGRPILEYQVQCYLSAGLDEENIIVVAGYKTDVVSSFLKRKYPHLTVIENEDYRATNNMYSLHIALGAVDCTRDESVLISNGDCIYEPAIVQELVAAGPGNFVAAEKSAYNQESMKITVSDNAIRDISKGISRSDAYGVSIDLYSLSQKSVQKLKRIMENYITRQGNKNLWTEVALKDLLGQQEFAPFDIQGKRWVEVDDLNDLRSADKLFSDFSIQNKKCFVVDLDGTVYLGDLPVQGTIDFIRKNISTNEFYFLTNNTSKTPADYVRRLRDFGINTDDSHIISPYIPLVEYLKIRRIQKVHLVANNSFSNYLLQELTTLELTTDCHDCQAVVVAYDTELTYDKISTASLALQSNDVEYIATHCDKVCPTEKGPIPDVGSIISLLETATGRVPDVVFGKPNPSLLNGVKRKHLGKEIVIVGDRLYTDKALADNASIDFILVLSGETKRPDVEYADSFPRLIVEDLGELLK
jgi:HAD superfamily hydrolase (TIGR01450 family)